MRQGRLRAAAEGGPGFYHCLSRVVDGRFVFDDPEKEEFHRLMREYEQYCEVRVLTYCIMSNHFHLLVEVPTPPEQKPSAEILLRKLARLTGHQDVGKAREQLEELRQRQGAEGEKQWLERHHARMWDVSAFMKSLKQRFTQWFNKRAGRRGALWEDRFKSVLVDGRGLALVTMAAYIDLNPVRAGIHDNPKDYRWSGYGEAMVGGLRAREGLRAIVAALMGRPVKLREALASYQQHVDPRGPTHRATTLPEVQGGQSGPGSTAQKDLLAVLAQKGKVPVTDYLRCRVRYFGDGAVFGSRQFVEEVFNQNRDRFGEKRKTGARRLRGVQEEFYALRDLQVRVFG